MDAILSGRRILAIDDDIVQRTMIERTLARAGCSVFMAEDGLRGLEMAQKETPDLILLDVIMPKMSGTEVCRQLKVNDRTKNIPVVFLTSLDTPKDIVEHFSAGADTHLTKPVNARELLNQIKMSLAGG